MSFVEVYAWYLFLLAAFVVVSCVFSGPVPVPDEDEVRAQVEAITAHQAVAKKLPKLWCLASVTAVVVIATLAVCLT